MGKPGRKKRKSRGNKFSQGKVSEGLGSAYNEGFQSLVDTSSRDYVYDEVDQYHDDITQSGLNEATRSMKVHQTKKENVLSLNMDSSDEEDEDESDISEEEKEEEEESDEERFRPFVAEDDIVKSKEEELPDERAWGKDRSLYYGSNVTDQSIRKRATHLHLAAVHDVANLELEANKERQRRMQASLEGFDPSDILNLGDDSEEQTEKKNNKKGSDVQLTILPKDVSKLSKDKKLKLLKQLSPEFILLTEDMLRRVEESEQLLEPVMKAFTDGRLTPCPAIDYVRTKYTLCKNYSLAVLSYVFLVCAKGHAAVKQHRVIKKLSTYRFLFQELEPLDRTMKPQLEELVSRLNNDLPLNLLCPRTQNPTLADNSSGKTRKAKKTENNEDSALDTVRAALFRDGADDEAQQTKSDTISSGGGLNRVKATKSLAVPAIDLKHGTVMWRGKEVKWSKLDPSMRKMLMKREQEKLIAKCQPRVAAQSAASGGPKPVKMLSLLTSQKRPAEEETEQTELPPTKKAKADQEGGEMDASDSDSDDEAAVAAARSRGRGDVELSADARRPIDKTIEKNRGLTPHRKKELKNPRIKYRTKYSEKVKRRRGQVRPVHKEIPYYTGEKSGINMYAIKSVKFK